MPARADRRAGGLRPRPHRPPDAPRSELAAFLSRPDRDAITCTPPGDRPLDPGTCASSGTSAHWNLTPRCDGLVRLAKQHRRQRPRPRITHRGTGLLVGAVPMHRCGFFRGNTSTNTTRDRHPQSLSRRDDDHEGPAVHVRVRRDRPRHTLQSLRATGFVLTVAVDHAHVCWRACEA